MMENKKQDTKSIQLSTFVDNNGSSRTPVQNAMLLPLKEVIGDLFSLVAADSEQIQDFNDPNKVTDRAVYSVRTLSNKSKLPIGSLLTIKVKDSKSAFTDEENTALLLGTAAIVVSFDELSHWSMSGNEGLSAKGIHKVNLTLQEAVKYEQGH